MYANKSITFIEVINNFGNSFINLFGFLSGLTKKDYSIDAYYLICRIQEKVSEKEVEDLFNNKILPKMPDYIWEIDDFNIFTQELIKFFKDTKLDEIFSDPLIRKPRNEIKFLKNTFKLGFSQMLNTTSEQIALIKSEKLKEKNVEYIKICREFIQTLEFIKNMLETMTREVNKISFNKRKLKSITNNYSIITLLFLRMYSISYKIRVSNLNLAIKETNYLGMERTDLFIGG